MRTNLLTSVPRDPLVRLVVTHWILGALTGLGCALLLLLIDVAGLRTLLIHSDYFWIGLLLLCSGFAITFGGVVAASAVIMAPADDKS